jgi:aspartate racemase
MGPEATSYFFDLIIKNTQAAKDQDHIQVLIYSNPKIPPRSEAILHRGPSPFPLLLESAGALRRAGADFVVIPCISAHFFLPQLVAKARIPFINLLEETVLDVRKNCPGLTKVGLIATTGTAQSKIIHNAFAKKGMEVIAPTAWDQKEVMDAIFGKRGIKAGVATDRPKKIILDVARKLIRAGAEAVMAGCTEVPLVLKEKDLAVPLIEPMRIGARACIKKAGYKIKM